MSGMTSAASDLADLARFIRSDDSLHKLEEYREVEKNALHAQHEAAVQGERHKKEVADLARAIGEHGREVKAFEDHVAKEKAELTSHEATLLSREMTLKAAEKEAREKASDLEVKTQKLKALEAQIKQETADLAKRAAELEKDLAAYKTKRSHLEKALRES